MCNSEQTVTVVCFIHLRVPDGCFYSSTPSRVSLCHLQWPQNFCALNPARAVPQSVGKQTRLAHNPPQKQDLFLGFKVYGFASPTTGAQCVFLFIQRRCCWQAEELNRRWICQTTAPLLPRLLISSSPLLLSSIPYFMPDSQPPLRVHALTLPPGVCVSFCHLVERTVDCGCDCGRFIGVPRCPFGGGQVGSEPSVAGRRTLFVFTGLFVLQHLQRCDCDPLKMSRVVLEEVCHLEQLVQCLKKGNVEYSVVKFANPDGFVLNI